MFRENRILGPSDPSTSNSRSAAQVSPKFKGRVATPTTASRRRDASRLANTSPTRRLSSAATIMDSEEPPEEVCLACCETCNRKFAVERLEKHMKVCVAGKPAKRKAFNAQEARWAAAPGAEDALKFIALAKKEDAKKKPDEEAQKSSRAQKWRRQSAALRQIATGGKKTPREGEICEPAEELDDRVPCPHCGRRFVSPPLPHAPIAQPDPANMLPANAGKRLSQSTTVPNHLHRRRSLQQSGTSRSVRTSRRSPRCCDAQRRIPQQARSVSKKLPTPPMPRCRSSTCDA